MWQELRHDYSNIDFDLSNKNGERMRAVFCRNKKFTFSCSHRLCDPPLTYEEIFNLLKPYFDKYVNDYKDYKIFRSPITNSIFRIILYSSQESKPIDFRYGKILYEKEIDNKENKIKHEYKNTNLIDKDKEKVMSFYARIEVELYNENSLFQYDGEKDPRIEDLCIKCHKNKPNVLISKCFHLVACSDCLRFDNSYRCFYCQKPFAGIHKIHFAVSGK